MKRMRLQQLRVFLKMPLILSKKTWIKHDVPQCGYCQPGQIMTASAFLTRNSNPKDEDIDNAMKMNICRCGTYPRIKKAVQSASEEIRNG